MKRILCLDPGPERTGWCVLDVDDWKVVQTGHADWETVLDMLRRADGDDIIGIAVAPIPIHGLGEAIRDRLTRAAAPR